MQSEKIDLLIQALCKVQQALKPAEKNRTNTYFKRPDGKPSTYADLDSIWDSCRTLLATNGLAVSQMSGFSNGQPILRTILCHISGQWIDGEYLLNPDKPTPQSLGSAFKYARRYSLEGAIGIVSTDDFEDDDGERAMNRTNNALPKPQPLRQPDKQPFLQENKPVSNKDLLAVSPLPRSGAISVGQEDETPWPDELATRVPGDEYVINFSKKYKGKTLAELGPESVLGFMNWLKKDAKENNKEISGPALEFVRQANLYLASQKQEDDIPF